MDAAAPRPAPKDESYDVPDSTDWLGTPLAGLVPLEQALRCHVCKDFYTSPMITSCSHTFCSLCIRRALASDGKCPLCRVTDQESRLRGNWAMREAVDTFVKAREAVLEFARTPPTAALSQDTPSPKRKAVGGEAGNGGREAKRTRTSARLSKTRAAQATAAMAIEEVEVPDGEDIVEYQPEDGLVECPICLRRMKPQQVDRHLDTTCPGSPQPPEPRQAPRMQPSFGSSSRSQQSSSPAARPPPERLPPLNYSMLNDANLRKKLFSLGLSTAGSRQLLERRHKEWIMLWNANCDSERPKRKNELLHDLDVWERTQGGKAPTQSRSANLGAQIKDKDFDGAAWATKHEDSFKDLIAAARKSRMQAGQKAVKEDDMSTDPSDQQPALPSQPALGHQQGGGIIDLTATEPVHSMAPTPYPPYRQYGDIAQPGQPLRQPIPVVRQHNVAAGDGLDGHRPRFFSTDGADFSTGADMAPHPNGPELAPS